MSHYDCKDCGSSPTEPHAPGCRKAAPTEIDRLRTALRWIADAGYVDHQSGNANFEYLQSVARGALGEGRKDG